VLVVACEVMSIDNKFLLRYRYSDSFSKQADKLVLSIFRSNYIFINEYKSLKKTSGIAGRSSPDSAFIH
jgi:hypothetical protein